MSEAVQAIEAGRIVVTATQRSARRIRQDFDDAMRGRGMRVWEPALVLSWESWTAQLWRRLVMEGQMEMVVLNRSQEMALWRDVIAEDLPTSRMEMRAEFAALAMEAWSLLHAYRVAGRLRKNDGNPDVNAFARWAEGFREKLKAGTMISRAQTEEVLTAKIEHVPIPSNGLELVGFAELAPNREGLLDAIKGRGGMIRRNAGQRFEVVPGVVWAHGEQEEISACAVWIRERLKRTPEARLGVVVPGLATIRRGIDRTFRRLLEPALESLESSAEMAVPWEFSLGVMMSETTAGAAALTLLRWIGGPLETQRVSTLMLTPFLGGAAEEAEHSARAAFDVRELRHSSRLRPEWELSELLHTLRGSRHASALPGLIEAIRGLAAAAEEIAGMRTRSYADWSEEMRRVLHVARWKEGVGKGSIAFQLIERWESVLDELTTLDFSGGVVSYREALREVERIASQTVFAPESRDAAVQVVGPREAAGECFDAIWFLRAGEETWPPHIGGNALLSRTLQREAGMPGSDMAADAERARALTERIAHSAKTVVFSYPRRTAGGAVQRSSGTLEAMHLTEMEAEPVVEAARVALDTVVDAEPLPLVPDAVIPGGTSVLEWQAACGFRAFALGRLGGARMEQTELGWDARQQGTLVHRVLELFWREVRTQAALRSMTEEERGAAIGRCFDEAAAKTQERTSWDKAYVRLQRVRMQRLLGAWMRIEAERTLPFAVSLSEEAIRDVALGPLRLNVRIDRVDVTELGEILIDYKTGSTTPTAWMGDRPDKPQLPIYAVLRGAERMEGVAFARIRPGETMQMEGFSQHEGSLPKRAKPKVGDLQEQMTSWNEVLTDLATAFYNGDARVDPKVYPQTCARCEARILCRLNRELLVADETEGEQGAEYSG